jgi:hypothetical protein
VVAALRLDVTYSHLRRVLDGERRSRSLLERYRALKANRATAAKRDNRTKEAK